MKWIFRSRSRSGFSLIEVTIAMGVASFAIIGIMGLVPSGLTTLRASVDASAMSRIMRTVATDARQSTNFAGIASGTSYFDDDGVKTTAAQSIYSAEMTVLPDAEALKALANPNLKAISVRVAKAPGGSTNAFNQANLPSYVLWISKPQ